MDDLYSVTNIVMIGQKYCANMIHRREGSWDAFDVVISILQKLMLSSYMEYS